MRRRQFITLLGGAAAWPRAALAQQPEQVRRIGAMLSLFESDPMGQSFMATFQQTLQALGWTDGRNIQIDKRWGVEDANLQAYATELVELKPDVILVAGAPGAAALQRITHTVPIVFVQVTDPVSLGFVKSLAHPGGNMTGFTSFEYSIAGKWLEILREIAPGITRVVVVEELINPTRTRYFQAIEAVATNVGVKVAAAEVNDAAEIEHAVESSAGPGGGLIVLPHIFTLANRDLTVGLVAQHRVPAVYWNRAFVAAGGLVAYGLDIKDMYPRAASYVDRILKGEKPADLPVQAPTKFELAVNLKTAKALGLTVPQSILARADEVIE